MPECRESKASFLAAMKRLKELLEAGIKLRLLGIDIDATEAEEGKFPKDHPASLGLPYQIDSTCTVKRGTNLAQGPVYPPMWHTTKAAGPTDPDPLTTLELKDLSYTYRSLILDLGALHLSIQWLTHTSALLCPRSDYESTMKFVHKKVRRARVGMALVFEDHVLVFLSSDLVFQPKWAKSRTDLPPPPPDFYSPEWSFLADLAKWIRKRVNCDRSGLACEVMRANNETFPGIGVYTVVELFFLAGLSMQLTEAEVFTNPSRAARIALAYLCYLHRSETGLEELLRPALHDGYLAPTKQQRLKYIDWLHVYAKDRTRLPERMAFLVDEYKTKIAELSSQDLWIRDENTTLYDVFEPSLVSVGLQLPHNLGHLVFGREAWTELGGTLSTESDPLTALFTDEELLDSPTFLRPNHYSPLFLASGDASSLSLPRRHIYTYRGAKKQLWSITPFPTNSQGCPDTHDKIVPTEITGDSRRHMLFSYIVQQTRKVAIGPLEYCGNAHLVRIGSSDVVVPCYGDPTLPEFYAIRDLKSRMLPPVLPGARRAGLNSEEAASLHEDIEEYAKSVSRKRARDGNDENEPQTSNVRKPKKKRLSADKRLALTPIN
ncbi:hypothetical protein R3P38DRAFT_3269243 [Favolaschia claudopus]|uniref:Uncharacterized protein n=1 Tax=Favolaschia claudopus TaxID=2862362 RepID=A0AAV9ZIU6_9AGAR